MCEFARPVLSPSVQAPGLKSVCPLKTYVSPHRRGGLASRLLEPTGKEQEERRGRGEDSRGVERRGKRERLFFFWAASQHSDRPASRLVPSVQWSRARRRLPCNWDSSFHTEKRDRENTATPPSTDPSPRLREDFLFWFKAVSNSKKKKLAIIRKQNPLA